MELVTFGACRIMHDSKTINYSDFLPTPIIMTVLLPDHTPRLLGRVAIQGIVLQSHIPMTTCLWLHKMANPI